MKYSIRDYAKALDAALADPKADREAIARRFLALVRRSNDESKLKNILNEAARLSRGKGGFREVSIASARPLAPAQRKALGGMLDPDDVVRYEIDPDLIAGVRIIVNDERQFDGTLKAKLDSLLKW